MGILKAPPQKQYAKPIPVKFEEHVLEQARALAKDMKIPLSDLVNQAVAYTVEKETAGQAKQPKAKKAKA